MATLTEIPVPDIGDFTDVPVTEILVAVGDHVDVEDPLVALESDKATMEVPSPHAGVVKELRVSVGDLVSEGSLLVLLAPDDSQQSEAAAPVTQEPSTREPAAREPQAVSSMPAGAEQSEVTAPVTEEPPVEAGAPPIEAGAPPVESGESAEAGEPGEPGRVYAGPVVRRRARELGIDLDSIAGSGPRGRITGEDLDRAAARAAPGSGTVAQATAGRRSAPQSPPNGQPTEPLELLPWPLVDFERYGPVERIELSRIKRATGANLARNWARIPHVTHQEDADITDLEDFRRALNSEQSEVKVTMLALLLKASVAALRRFPRLNASLDGQELVLKRYWHLGFAADTEQGLVVPVVRDVDRKGLLELAAEVAALAARARAGSLTPAEISGATFTISSLGGIGGTGFTPIINAPEVAILGVSRSAMRPLWDGQGFVPRLVLPLSLSYDHRVIDGAEAARFCAHLAGLLADMRRVLL